KADQLPDAFPHNPMVDKNSDLWASDLGRYGPPKPGAKPYPDKLPYCTDPNNKFAKYFPEPGQTKNTAVHFDITTMKAEGIQICNGLPHLMFNMNRKDLYFSGGDQKVVSWVDIDVWAKTHDPQKSVSWCPMVVDSNSTTPSKRPAPGDVTITPD